MRSEEEHEVEEEVQVKGRNHGMEEVTGYVGEEEEEEVQDQGPGWRQEEVRV